MFRNNDKILNKNSFELKQTNKNERKKKERMNEHVEVQFYIFWHSFLKNKENLSWWIGFYASLSSLCTFSVNSQFKTLV